MVLKWILEDSGKVLMATMNNPIGVVFKTRQRDNGGSDCEVWVGDTAWNGQALVHLVSVSHSKHDFESDAAKLEAIQAFQLWAASVVIVAASDGRGNWLYGYTPDE